MVSARGRVKHSLQASLGVTGAGDGTWEQVEDLNRWILVFPVIEISDGSRVRSEGVLDLETRMLKGKMYDAS